MYLIDTEGKVYCDESSVDERLVSSLKRSNPSPTLVPVPEYNILYRFEENGDLTMFYVGEEKFKKLTVGLFGQHTFQDTNEYISEDARIVPFGSGEAQVYLGDTIFIMPAELLMRW